MEMNNYANIVKGLENLRSQAEKELKKVQARSREKGWSGPPTRLEVSLRSKIEAYTIAIDVVEDEMQ